MEVIFDNSPTHNTLETIYKCVALSVIYSAGYIQVKLESGHKGKLYPLGEALAIAIFHTENDEEEYKFFKWFMDWEKEEFRKTLIKWNGGRKYGKDL